MGFFSREHTREPRPINNERYKFSTVKKELVKTLKAAIFEFTEKTPSTMKQKIDLLREISDLAVLLDRNARDLDVRKTGRTKDISFDVDPQLAVNDLNYFADKQLPMMISLVDPVAEVPRDVIEELRQSQKVLTSTAERIVAAGLRTGTNG